MTTELLPPATLHRRPARWAATREEFWALPESTLPTEYLNGEIIMAPAPTVSHQTVVGNIYFLLRAFAEEHGTGTFFIAPLDVMLPTGDVAQPDVFFLTNDEAARARGAKRVQGAPAFLIEVLSPGSLRQDTITKRDLYERNGVREYWAVDLGRKRLSQFVLLDGHYALTELAANDTMRAVVLDGFAMSVDDLLGIA